jgi:hypothetical protein
MCNVIMFPYDGAPATVTRLSGTAVPTGPGKLIDMDDVTSQTVRVRRAAMMMPAATMQALMNQYIPPSADTAIKPVSIGFRPARSSRALPSASLITVSPGMLPITARSAPTRR